MSVPQLTGKERSFGDGDLIVTKTDTGGKLTYGNRTFLSISEVREQDAIGKPHSLIRHPDMPKAVFRLLWGTIQEGREIFAYVLNRALNGDHYWVFAHVTPTFDEAGTVSGYHSNRRVPDRRVIDQVIAPLYRDMAEAERRETSAKRAIDAATARLNDVLNAKGLDYDRFIFSLQS
jgi:PAS domain S-box-containing protein